MEREPKELAPRGSISTAMPESPICPLRGAARGCGPPGGEGVAAARGGSKAGGAASGEIRAGRGRRSWTAGGLGELAAGGASERRWEAGRPEWRRGAGVACGSALCGKCARG
jgi:hypothetical protein